MPAHCDAVLKILHESVEELNEQFAPPNRLESTQETILYGPGTVLDSLGFVNFVSIVEEKCEKILGLSLSLTDSSGSGDGSDPFHSIGTLTDFLDGLVVAKKQGA